MLAVVAEMSLTPASLGGLPAVANARLPRTYDNAKAALEKCRI
jgi:hypothetical protein